MDFDSPVTIVGLVVVALVGAVLYFLYYVGAFYKVTVTTGRPFIPEVVIAYKHHVGNYKGAGAHFGEVVELCPGRTTIGIYYDDPQRVNPDKCNYIAGAIIAEGSSAIPDQNLVSKVEKKGFKLAKLPKIDAAVRANHPFVNTVSIIFAVMKVYPRMEKYIKEERLRAYPFLEICEKDYTHFMAPLSKHEEFFVDEVKHKLEEEYGA